MAQARSTRRIRRRSTRRTGPGRRLPTWAVALAAVGAFLLLMSGGLVAAGQWLLGRYDVEQDDLFGEGAARGSDIEGPLNILLVGIDTRPSRPEEPARSDTIMIFHVDRDLEHAWLVSIPRDLLVEIPAFAETGYPGGFDKINAAMFEGSRQLPGQEMPDLPRGFSLLARTVGDLTGISRWDAGALIDFEGFVGVVDALGGVTIELPERVVSEHRQPDGSHRPLDPDGQGFQGPQAVYEPGVHHLEGWQALDLARQRYGLERGDFDRQENQRRLVEAIIAKALSRDVVTDPVTLDRVVRAAGDSLVFDGRGNQAIDFAFALRDLRPDSLTMLGLPATSVESDEGYQGEELDPVAHDLFGALQQDRLDGFLATHPEFTN